MMRTGKRLGALFCLFLFFFEGQGQTEKDHETLLDQPDYLLSYPSTWHLDQSGQMGTKFILFTGKTSAGFRDNLNLIVQDLKGSGLDLDKYVNLSEGQVKAMIGNSQIVESQRKKNRTTEFQEVIFTGDQGVFHLQWRQRYWVKGERVFILTFTASQETYADYIQVNNKVFDSFNIK